jgi:ATP-dependent RNA helicase HrpB
VALDVMAGRRGEASEAAIRIACAVEREWLEATRVEVVHDLHDPSGRVRASERRYYDALVLAERPVRVDPAQAGEMLGRAYLAAPRTDRDERLIRRLRFAAIEREFDTLAVAAAANSSSVQEVDVAAQLPWAERRELDRLAPESLVVPSGRAVPLDYLADGSVVAAVKLQELFGLAETPRIGPEHRPVVFELRAPNGRAVQMTSDLRSFWQRTYPEVRRELRGRYPRHPWPEDPWSAVPTARTVRRSG